MIYNVQRGYMDICCNPDYFLLKDSIQSTFFQQRNMNMYASFVVYDQLICLDSNIYLKAIVSLVYYNETPQ